MRMNHELKVQVFSMRESDGFAVGMWEDAAELFAGKEDKNGLSVFSSHAAAKRTSTKFYVRTETKITRHNRVMVNGIPFILVGISEKGMDLIELSTVQVADTICTIYRRGEQADEYKRPVYGNPERVMEFPAVLAEKYLGFTQNVPMAQTEITYVLVTPKEISLEVSDLVDVDGRRYAVRVCHTLDEYKNEYEITRKDDV